MHEVDHQEISLSDDPQKNPASNDLSLDALPQSDDPPQARGGRRRQRRTRPTVTNYEFEEEVFQEEQKDDGPPLVSQRDNYMLNNPELSERSTGNGKHNGYNLTMKRQPSQAEDAVHVISKNNNDPELEAGEVA